MLFYADIMNLNSGKIAAGKRAAELIKPSQIVGLGTGSTAACFIRSLIEKSQNGLEILCVSSSDASTKLAREGGLKVLDIQRVDHIDIYVDGADEIDYQKRMIKGGGGAHVREKILAAASKQMVVIVDESKVVEKLGVTKLPLEILPFGSNFTLKKIQSLGLITEWRRVDSHDPHSDLFVTENDNYIIDILFERPLENPENLQTSLLPIPGIVETGFFFNMADIIIVGRADGSTFNI